MSYSIFSLNGLFNLRYVNSPTGSEANANTFLPNFVLESRRRHLLEIIFDKREEKKCSWDILTLIYQKFEKGKNECTSE